MTHIKSSVGRGEEYRNTNNNNRETNKANDVMCNDKTSESHFKNKSNNVDKDNKSSEHPHKHKHRHHHHSHHSHNHHKKSSSNSNSNNVNDINNNKKNSEREPTKHKIPTQTNSINNNNNSKTKESKNKSNNSISVSSSSSNSSTSSSASIVSSSNNNISKSNELPSVSSSNVVKTNYASSVHDIGRENNNNNNLKNESNEKNNSLNASLGTSTIIGNNKANTSRSQNNKERNNNLNSNNKNVSYRRQRFATINNNNNSNINKNEEPVKAETARHLTIRNNNKNNNNNKEDNNNNTSSTPQKKNSENDEHKTMFIPKSPQSSRPFSLHGATPSSPEKTECELETSSNNQTDKNNISSKNTSHTRLPRRARATGPTTNTGNEKNISSHGLWIKNNNNDNVKKMKKDNGISASLIPSSSVSSSTTSTPSPRNLSPPTRSNKYLNVYEKNELKGVGSQRVLPPLSNTNTTSTNVHELAGEVQHNNVQTPLRLSLPLPPPPPSPPPLPSGAASTATSHLFSSDTSSQNKNKENKTETSQKIPKFGTYTLRSKQPSTPQYSPSPPSASSPSSRLALQRPAERQNENTNLVVPHNPFIVSNKNNNNNKVHEMEPSLYSSDEKNLSLLHTLPPVLTQSVERINLDSSNSAVQLNINNSGNNNINSKKEIMGKQIDNVKQDNSSIKPTRNTESIHDNNSNNNNKESMSESELEHSLSTNTSELEVAHTQARSPSLNETDFLIEQIHEVARSALHYLPIEWSRPIIRALSLQMLTEQLPAQILFSINAFDIYTELKGELPFRYTEYVENGNVIPITAHERHEQRERQRMKLIKEREAKMMEMMSMMFMMDQNNDNKNNGLPDSEKEKKIAQGSESANETPQGTKSRASEINNNFVWPPTQQTNNTHINDDNNNNNINNNNSNCNSFENYPNTKLLSRSSSPPPSQPSHIVFSDQDHSTVNSLNNNVNVNPINNNKVNPFQTALLMTCPWDEVIDLVHFHSVAPAVLRFRINGIKETRITEIVSKYEQRYGVQQKNNNNNSAAIPTRAQVAIDLFRPHLQRDVLFGAQLIQDGVRVMYPGARLFPFTSNPFPSCASSSSLSTSAMLHRERSNSLHMPSFHNSPSGNKENQTDHPELEECGEHQHTVLKRKVSNKLYNLLHSQPPFGPTLINGSVQDVMTHSNNNNYNNNSVKQNIPGANNAPMLLFAMPHAERTYSAITFEVMPSIFLKRRHDLQKLEMKTRESQMMLMQQEQNNNNSSTNNNKSKRTGASSTINNSDMNAQAAAAAELSRKLRHKRRYAVHPYFNREFIASFASGNDAACLFATTLSPEFFVGLPLFNHDPLRALISSIRATLHRWYMVFTAECIRTGLAWAPYRYALHAPPLDLGLTYLRENTLYVASTPGLASKLFTLNSVQASKRFIISLNVKTNQLNSSVSEGEASHSNYTEKEEEYDEEYYNSNYYDDGHVSRRGSYRSGGLSSFHSHSDSMSNKYDGNTRRMSSRNFDSKNRRRKLHRSPSEEEEEEEPDNLFSSATSSNMSFGSKCKGMDNSINNNNRNSYNGANEMERVGVYEMPRVKRCVIDLIELNNEIECKKTTNDDDNDDDNSSNDSEEDEDNEDERKKNEECNANERNINQYYSTRNNNKKENGLEFKQGSSRKELTKHGTSRENNENNEMSVPGINAIRDNNNTNPKNTLSSTDKVGKVAGHGSSNSKLRSSKPHKSNNLVLPHALVLSTLEFWRVMRASLISCLLRVLLILNHVAYEMTTVIWDRVRKHKNALKSKHKSSLCSSSSSSSSESESESEEEVQKSANASNKDCKDLSQSTTHKASPVSILSHYKSIAQEIHFDHESIKLLEHAEARVHKYIASTLNTLSKHTQHRLCEFYYARVENYLELYSFHSKSTQEHLDAQLHALAVRRFKRENKPDSESLTSKKNNNNNNNNNNGLHKTGKQEKQEMQNTEQGEETMTNYSSTLSLCDALAHFLSVEAAVMQRANNDNNDSNDEGYERSANINSSNKREDVNSSRANVENNKNTSSSSLLASTPTSDMFSVIVILLPNVNAASAHLQTSTPCANLK